MANAFGIPFKCSRNFQGNNFQLNDSRTDLCFSDSFCVVENSLQQCSGCAEGWINSNVRGHFPNCATPVLFYPIFFAFHLLTTIIGVFLICRKLVKDVKSSPLRYFGFSWVAYMISEALYVFFLFLEQGNFTGTQICLILCCAIGTEALIRYTNLMLFTSMPLLRQTQRSFFNKLWRIYQAIIILLLLSTGISTAVFAAKENGTLQGAQEYNVFFYSFTQVIFLETFLIAIPAVYLAKRLINELDAIKKNSESSAQQQRLDHLIEKLKFSRFSITWAGFAFTAFIQTEFFLYILYGSVPYEFVFSIFFNCNFSFPGILFLLRKEDTGSSNPEANTVPSITNSAILMNPFEKYFGGRKKHPTGNGNRSKSDI